MDEDELSAMTVVNLKARLKELSLATSGKKAELIARLMASDEEEDVLILDDDEEDSISITEIDDDDEVLEAEVFEAEILEEEILEPILSIPRTTGPTQIRTHLFRILRI